MTFPVGKRTNNLKKPHLYYSKYSCYNLNFRNIDKSLYAEDHDLETPGKFLKTRLCSVVCEDSHVNFLKRVPFSHICFINNDDEILLHTAPTHF